MEMVQPTALQPCRSQTRSKRTLQKHEYVNITESSDVVANEVKEETGEELAAAFLAYVNMEKRYEHDVEGGSRV